MTVRRKDHVFKLLRELATAPNATSFEQRLQILQSCAEYVDNVKLRTYLRTEWLSCIPLWAGYHRTAFHGGLNTNNHQESMNRRFKQQYLPECFNTRLDSVLDVWKERVLPEFAREYQLDNARSHRCAHGPHIWAGKRQHV